MTRHSPMRRCVRAGALAMAPLALAVTSALAAQSPQVPLAPRVIPQFAQALPTVGNMAPVAAGAAQLTFTMCEFNASILPPGTLVAGQTPLTTVWGYISGGACTTVGSGFRSTPLRVPYCGRSRS